MNLNQAYSSGGSTSSAQSISNTAGVAASKTAQQVTAETNASAYSAWKEAAEYNSEQARIQREWQEQMANSVYQRTVEDMRKAGINPVLATGMGLGTAATSGGSAASISPSQVYNAQTFPESNSASQSYGNSWNQSESGLMTFAGALTELGKSLIESISSSKTIQLSIEGIQQGWEEFTENQKTKKENIYNKFMSRLYELTGGRLGKTSETNGNFSSGGSNF